MNSLSGLYRSGYGIYYLQFIYYFQFSRLHRDPKHLRAFFHVELGTSCSLDENGQLIVKGRFKEMNIKNVLSRYIKEYVKCTCRSIDTFIIKENGISFLHCNLCHSKRSVQTIKNGFQAVTVKRSSNWGKKYCMYL